MTLTIFIPKKIKVNYRFVVIDSTLNLRWDNICTHRGNVFILIIKKVGGVKRSGAGQRFGGKGSLFVRTGYTRALFGTDRRFWEKRRALPSGTHSCAGRRLCGP